MGRRAGAGVALSLGAGLGSLGVTLPLGGGLASRGTALPLEGVRGTLAGMRFAVLPRSIDGRFGVVVGAGVGAGLFAVASRLGMGNLPPSGGILGRPGLVVVGWGAGVVVVGCGVPGQPGMPGGSSKVGSVLGMMSGGTVVVEVGCGFGWVDVGCGRG